MEQYFPYYHLTKLEMLVMRLHVEQLYIYLYIHPPVSLSNSQNIDLYC